MRRAAGRHRTKDQEWHGVPQAGHEIESVEDLTLPSLLGHKKGCLSVWRTESWPAECPSVLTVEHHQEVTDIPNTPERLKVVELA